MIRPLVSATMAAAVLLAACADDSTTPIAEPAPTQLASVIPTGGSAAVEPNAPIVIVFTRAMMMDMTRYMVLHEGSVQGPAVPGSWSWDAARTRATFTPAAPLKAQTAYTIHLGGAMTDSAGRHVGFDEHGGHMGGHPATAAMMGSGMMGGGMMGGGMMGGGMMGGTMMGDGTMMGPGWRHADGTYGMVFTFTTA